MRAHDRLRSILNLTIYQARTSLQWAMKVLEQERGFTHI